MCWLLPTAFLLVLAYNPLMKQLLEIGRKIAEERKSQGLTQEGLAGLTDMDRSFISEIENGHKNFSVTTLLRISEALKVKAAYFLEAGD